MDCGHSWWTQPLGELRHQVIVEMAERLDKPVETIRGWVRRARARKLGSVE
jgi:hypothetical protein